MADQDDRETTVREYYAAIDEGRYDDLAAVLAPQFVQFRPDRTFEGRAAFVEFMRDERPNPDAVHDLAAVYPEGSGIAARGHLVDGGEELFEFVDVFHFVGDRVVELRTFTR